MQKPPIHDHSKHHQFNCELDDLFKSEQHPFKSEQHPFKSEQHPDLYANDENEELEKSLGELVKLFSEDETTACGKTFLDLPFELEMDFDVEVQDQADADTIDSFTDLSKVAQDQADADNINSFTDLIKVVNGHEGPANSLQSQLEVSSYKASCLKPAVKATTFFEMLRSSMLIPAIPCSPAKPHAPKMCPTPALDWTQPHANKLCRIGVSVLKPSFLPHPTVPQLTPMPTNLLSEEKLSTAGASNSKGAGKGTQWTQNESNCLRHGMKMFGSKRNKWTLIKRHFQKELQQRSNVDLKDRWRNIQGRKQNRKIKVAGKTPPCPSIASPVLPSMRLHFPLPSGEPKPKRAKVH